ncbi:exodeoxyribonuclease-like isoform X1 [Dendronephthya gigantea]|uniref:exodeoxyribonuclease-like isoform X1 n=2 Tax=Dendronephthya gigantea TaxID=151771 RepID=UPI00106AD69E|nr:exodeoxyribonuclease-like isoform X1 [Dendronephthya gigantea]
MPRKRKVEEDTSKKDTKKQKVIEFRKEENREINSEEEPSTSKNPYKLPKVDKSWNMKISSWNVNGLKAWIQKSDSLKYVRKEDPDIFCIQETKCDESSLPKEASFPGYFCYWANSETKGYSGVGLFSKKKPSKITYGIGVSEHDKEGRVITAEYEQFFLVTSYIPNSGQGLKRLDYRQTWDKAFRDYLKKLDNTKPVILCGDLNVAHKEIDLTNPKTNKKTAGFTKEERENFTVLLEQGYVDTYRHFYPDRKNQYSFWSYRGNAREKNVGWRLDYFVVSERFLPKVVHSFIRDDIMGSDHAPVVILLSI